MRALTRILADHHATDELVALALGLLLIGAVIASMVLS